MCELTVRWEIMDLELLSERIWNRDRAKRGAYIKRTMGLFLVVALVVCNVGESQEWAQKMFKTTTYNFGNLARGSKPEFKFDLTNRYKDEVHIAGVRSSCGCTIVEITKSTLKHLETGQIICRFDTISHIGAKKSVVTVTFDRPYTTEVQLMVSGFVRRDVVMQPGVVEFGQVRKGVAVERKIQIEYAGRPDWQIVDVRSNNTDYEVKLEPSKRLGGRVSYELLVRLKESSPPGYLHDHLTLVTNDPMSDMIEIPVEGRVLTDITVSPASLALGDICIGDRILKKIVVRSDKPFRIVDIRCEDDCFQFLPAGGLRKTHIVPITFVAQGKPGRINQRIHIETDLDQGSAAELVATATILTGTPETVP